MQEPVVRQAVLVQGRPQGRRGQGAQIARAEAQREAVPVLRAREAVAQAGAAQAQEPQAALVASATRCWNSAGTAIGA